MSEKKKLVPGSVNPAHLAGLLRFTGIHGESVLAALRGHLVEGRKQADVCREFKVKPPLLSRKVADLNEVSDSVREVSKFYR
ncbi:PapB/FocB family fimbrial expression transcriptional regulator [Pseudomonas cerasi]|uniref:PapB/FocB family fimbrial expression transcriptional regulator n=1 Tax=Pseudomonas cerasi TaxID=1583341 RepID=UPI0009F20F12|nr:PapB/FocB family fimbrial expression transcriptional regulator [Pseudomonas cerasi]